MAHLIDNSKGFNAFVAYGAAAWHGLGKIFSTEIDSKTALNESGADFTVLKLPNIHSLPNGEELISEDSFFTVRTDVNKVLGSRLGKDYEVMQNEQGFNLVDEILQQGKCKIETAGVIDEGRKVFICLKVDKSLFVGGSDEVKQYLLICLSHDGSMATTVMFTNVRVVCNNTLSAALRGATGAAKIRHTKNADERVKEALRALKLLEDNTQINAENYGKMKEATISKEEMFNYFGNVFMNEKEMQELKAGKNAKEVLSKQKQNQMGDVLRFASIGTGQAETFTNGNPTLWTAYNAVTGFFARKKYDNANDRANSLLFGTAAATMQRAAVLANEPAKIQTLHKTNTNFNLN